MKFDPRLGPYPWGLEAYEALREWGLIGPALEWRSFAVFRTITPRLCRGRVPLGPCLGGLFFLSCFLFFYTRKGEDSIGGVRSSGVTPANAAIWAMIGQRWE